MKKLVATLLFLTATFLLSAIAIDKHFSGTLFTVDEINAILKNSKTKDEIVLNDGLVINCDIIALPDIIFFFGAIPLDKDAIAALSFVKADKANKMQVIYRSGFCFIADFSDQTITYSLENESENEINCRDVSYITFGKKKYGLPANIPDRIFNLKLKDGNQLPVDIQNNSISLAEGMKDYYLSVDDIVELHFNGGLYGFVKDQDMKIKEQKFAFVKERCLLVFIPVIDKTIGLPWEQISSLSREHIFQQTDSNTDYVEDVYLANQKTTPEDATEKDVCTALEDVNDRTVREGLDNVIMKWENICFKGKKFDKEIKNLQKIQGENYVADLSSSFAQFENNREKLLSSLNYINMLLSEAENEYGLSATEKEKIASEIKMLQADLDGRSQKYRRLKETLKNIWETKRKETEATQHTQKQMQDKFCELADCLEEERRKKTKSAEQLSELKTTVAAYEKELKFIEDELSKQESCYQKTMKDHTFSKDYMLSEIEVLNKTLCEERSSSAKLRISFDEIEKRAQTFEKQLDVLTNSLVGKQQELEIIKMQSNAKQDELQRQISQMNESHVKEKKQKDALINSFIDQLEGFKSE